MSLPLLQHKSRTRCGNVPFFTRKGEEYWLGSEVTGWQGQALSDWLAPDWRTYQVSQHSQCSALLCTELPSSSGGFTARPSWPGVLILYNWETITGGRRLISFLRYKESKHAQLSCEGWLDVMCSLGRWSVGDGTNDFLTVWNFVFFPWSNCLKDLGICGQAR